jgi:antitoxin MazE
MLTTENPRVSRWGHSLAVRIPARLARQVDLKEGSPVEMTVEDSKLVITPAEAEPPRYDLAQLIAGIDQDNVHEEIDLGEAVGAELL